VKRLGAGSDDVSGAAMFLLSDTFFISYLVTVLHTFSRPLKRF